MTTISETIRETLLTALHAKGVIDMPMAECPDVEALWESIAEEYLPDGLREYGQYPNVSLGWMMFIGMAVAKRWDTDWDTYADQPNKYATLRDVRGYDYMDEYIIEEVLQLDADTQKHISALVADTAVRTDSLLRHSAIEAGTKEAFQAYVAALHQLYLMGMAVQLFHMGYRMTKVK